MRNTVVRLSPVHGKGLFALKHFSPEDHIEPIKGWIAGPTSRSKYVSLSRIWDLGSLVLTNKVKYINGSKVRIDLDLGFVVASRDIHPREELFCAYYTPGTLARIAFLKATFDAGSGGVGAARPILTWGVLRSDAPQIRSGLPVVGASNQAPFVVNLLPYLRRKR